MGRMKIKRNDLVQVILGEDSGTVTGGDDNRGVRARVIRVLPAQNKVIVEGVNTVRRATRPDPRKGVRGGFTEKELPVNASNVMLVCRNCDRPVRVGIKREDGRKIRFCRKCGQEV